MDMQILFPGTDGSGEEGGGSKSLPSFQTRQERRYKLAPTPRKFLS